MISGTSCKVNANIHPCGSIGKQTQASYYFKKGRILESYIDEVSPDHLRKHSPVLYTSVISLILGSLRW